MRKLGIYLIIIGIVLGIKAFNMETSVEIPITSRSWSGYNSNRIHNLDLADRRRNLLIGAGISLISGILLFGFGSTKSVKEISLNQAASFPIATQVTDRKCPYCAETIKLEAVICRFCNRDVPKIESDTPKHVNDQKEEFRITKVPRRIFVRMDEGWKLICTRVVVGLVAGIVASVLLICGIHTLITIKYCKYTANSIINIIEIVPACLTFLSTVVYTLINRPIIGLFSNLFYICITLLIVVMIGSI